MLISREKKKSNIAEYLLYMWQLEDLFRAHDFNESSLHSFLVAPLNVEADLKIEIWDFYKKMRAEMLSQGLEKTGHMDELREIMRELAFLHHSLLNVENDRNYQNLYKDAEQHLRLLKQRSSQDEISEVELALNGLYGLLMLRLKKREISKETEESMQTFSKLLAYLSSEYHKRKEA